MELQGSVQRYDWGKVGSSSLVARLASKSSLIKEIDETSPYAELWFGTHPNGPSNLYFEEEKFPLLAVLQNSPSGLLGEKSFNRFGNDLPFLLKILSVGKALSIQAHPNIQLAKELHANRPDLYKDANHKPEMAVALTPFEMLCGFRKFEEILGFVKEIKQLKTVIGEDVSSRFINEPNVTTLSEAFKSLMICPVNIVHSQLELLISDTNVPEKDLIQRLHQQFPGDVGIFCVYFLQHFTLEPKQAVFLPANEPHAYIHGDCVEIMATSDNVVRAGLTPKFKDVDTLCSMLTYTTGVNWIIQGNVLANGSAILYDPPEVEEFALMRYESSTSFSLKPHFGSCSIILVVEGNGKTVPQSGVLEPGVNLSPGTALFIPANSQYSGMQIVPNENETLVIFEALATPR